MTNERERVGTVQDDAALESRDRSGRLEHEMRASADEVRARVGEATEKLRRRAAEGAESQREEIASMARDLGAAIRKAAEELHDRGDERTGEWADALAEQLERAGDYLHEHELRSLFDQAQRFARRRPGLVMGGLFVAGLAASRFLKAERDDRIEQESEFDRDEPFDDFDADIGETVTPPPAHGSARPNVIPAQPRGNAPKFSPREEDRLP